MKEGTVMPRLLAHDPLKCEPVNDQIMRYFSVLACNPGTKEVVSPSKPLPAFADRALEETLLGELHSAKVDTGFA
jgi:hypothetical protein